MEGQYVAYTFYRVAPEWRRLVSPDERAAQKEEFAQVLDDSAPDHVRRTDLHVVDAIPLAFSVIDRARAGGRTGARTASFRGRMLELEAAGDPVTVATAIGPDAYVGTLSVGTDLLVIATSAGVETVVALPAVASVSRVR